VRGIPWTTADVAVLRTEAHRGAAWLASRLGRTEKSIRRAAERHRVSLRRPGVRRGLVLGQPAGTSWATSTAGRAHAIRQDALDAGLDLGDLEERAREIVHGDQLLCPMCARRTQHPRHGVCRPCWMRALAEAHDDVKAERAAQRDLWAARQRKKREGRT
jgi:hypothetical protein